MNPFRRTVLPVCTVLLLAGAKLGAQSSREAAGPDLPLRKVTIYSSGVASFEHSGTLTGPALVKLPFKTGAVNDALKSLALNDPASASPSVTYPSELGLQDMLASLSVDLSGNPGMAEILGRLRGEEAEVAAPGPIRGRIAAVEYRAAGGGAAEAWLSLFTAGGVRLVSLKEIDSLRFIDPRINADLNRALDLIMASRNSAFRELSLSLPGSGSRPVSLSYVIPSPVWKVSYRLDLPASSPANPQAEALFQGWAIVDNDGGADWKEVELSLAAGRPASFIQNLYPPYYVNRPVMPLAIAGAAAAETY
jgi:hypothetical protein